MGISERKKYFKIFCVIIIMLMTTSSLCGAISININNLGTSINSNEEDNTVRTLTENVERNSINNGTLNDINTFDDTEKGNQMQNQNESVSDNITNVTDVQNRFLYHELIGYGTQWYHWYGDWYQQGAHGMRQSMFHGGYIDYQFNIGTSNLKDLSIGFYFCSWSTIWYIGGPDIRCYNWNTGVFDVRQTACGNQDNLVWKWYNMTNPNNYVKDNRIRVEIYGDYWDDVVVDQVGVRWNGYIRTIYFYTDPIDTNAKVKFDGTSYTNNQYTTKEDGTYAIYGQPPPGYLFHHWSSTGSVTIANTQLQSTTATVFGSGSIKAWFEIPVRRIDFYTDPVSGGSIRFDGTTFYDHQYTSRADGPYPIVAQPASNFNFQKWTKDGSITIANLNAASTTATVSGSGSIKAWYTPKDYTIYFYTNPASGGRIKFDNVIYNNGGSVNKVAGSYSVQAMPTSPYIFDHWVPTGYITIQNPSSSSTTATTTGGGTITAHYRLPTGDIEFYIDPSLAGTITFNNHQYSNGQSTTVDAGSYPIIANPQSSYQFVSWSTTGSVSIASQYSQSTTATVSGNGEITAIFQLRLRTITFYTNPSSMGSITFASITYTNSQSVQKNDGTYPITANTPTDYSFEKWTVTGAITIANLNSQMTSATVSGDGSIKAWFIYNPSNHPPNQPITPNPSNGATGVPINTALSCVVSDPDHDSMKVAFYLDGQFVGETSWIPDGGTASISLLKVLHWSTTYHWYTVASDGKATTQSTTWSFTTKNKPEIWVLLVGVSMFTVDRMNGDRFNNDVWDHFGVLDGVYGIPRDHMKIYVSNANLDDGYEYEPPNQRPTSYDGAPTKANCFAGLDWLKQQSDSNDIVWIFMTDHGGDDPSPHLCFSDGTTDENMFPSELGPKITSIAHDKLILILEHCFGGGFIDACKGTDHIIMTATDSQHTSYAHEINCDKTQNPDVVAPERIDGLYNFPKWSERSWNPFVRYISEGLSGLADLKIDGGNEDGATTLKEVFNYAVAKGDARDRPQLEANGNGIPNENADYTTADGINLGRYNMIFSNYSIRVTSDIKNKIFSPGKISYNVTISNLGDVDLINGSLSISIFKNSPNVTENPTQVFDQEIPINVQALKEKNISMTWDYDYNGNFSIVVEVYLINESLDSQIYSFTIGTNTNNPPTKPELINPTWWLIDEEYQLKIKSTDSEGDQIEYYVDWGDLTNTGWFGPYASGVECNTTHTWHAESMYIVKVKARDSYNTESNWSEIEVNITSNSTIETPKAFILGFCIDRRPVGEEYIYFRVETDSIYVKLPPGMVIKILPADTEIVVSTDYKLGLIVDNKPEYILFGFFPTFLISDQTQKTIAGSIHDIFHNIRLKG